MLRWLLILTMALLPWHGWAGASLAGAPAEVGQEALRGVAVVAVMADHGAHHGQASTDCLDEAEAAADHHPAGGADGGCPGCSMCHSCSPVGLPAMAGVPPADAAPAQRPAAGETRFASADGAAGLKPPIS
ncbi:MAG: hypothetical protein ACYC0T_05930 [Ramlibacter sp.]